MVQISEAAVLRWLRSRLVRRGQRAGFALILLLGGCVAPQADRQETRELNAAADLEVFHVRAPTVEEPVTLDVALAYADRYNIEVWLAALERRFQHELTTQSLLKMLPSFIAGGNASRRSEFDAATAVSLATGEESLEPSYTSEKEIRTWNLEATWSLLDFGISFLRARQQSNRISIATERERRVRQNLAMKVREAWWQAVTSRVSAEFAAAAAEEVADALAKIRSEVAAKSISQIEGLRIETRLLELQEELRRYRRDYLSAKTELATLMGLPPGAEIELAEVDLTATPKSLTIDIEALEHEALRSRPELFEKDFEESISRDEAHLAIVRMFPDLVPFWRYDDDRNRLLSFNHWNTAGIRVTWDLLLIPQQLQQHAAMKLQTELVARRRTAIAIAILTQLHLAIIDYQDAREQLETTASIAEKRRELASAIANAASEGKSHGGEVLDQRMRHLRAQAKHLVAYARLMAAEARLSNTVGRDIHETVEPRTAADTPGMHEPNEEDTEALGAPDDRPAD
jgi:outer membrane protein TolC